MPKISKRKVYKQLKKLFKEAMKPDITFEEWAEKHGLIIIAGKV